MKMEKEYLNVLEFAKKILEIPSPSGFTKDAMNFLIQESKKRGLSAELQKSGSLVVTLPGKTVNVLCLGAHVDTLGGIVRAINPDGTLRFSVLGGPILPTYDGEYCYIFTRTGKKYTGTFLSDSPAVHVYDNARTLERDIEHMHVRIDEVVHSRSDVEKLDISNGDFIALDPKTVILDSGYIKSRFLDDKLSVAILFGLIDYLQKEKITPEKTLKFVFSAYEEVGFGSSYIPECDEFIAVDMGCVGADLDGSEEKVSICAKDAKGPYDYDVTTRLINLAKDAKLDYAVDIFKHYSSDVSAALQAGNNFKGGLIGSGVAASHGMERSHINGVKNTLELLKLYVK